MKSGRTDDTNRLKKIVDRLSAEDGKYICSVIYKDPFTDIYPMLLVIYIFILGGFLLWPFDFFSTVKNNVRWIKKSNGIEFLKNGQAVSDSPNREFCERLVNGTGMTIEMWLQTEDLKQTGPGVILSYSIDPPLCNFVVGQWRDQLVVQVRTTKTDLDGTNPFLSIHDVFTSQSLKHMIIVYDLSEQRVYINGKQKARSDILKGNFSNWDPSCKLTIGNEVSGNRPWKGKIYYAAVFDRPLTEPEIHRTYLSGLRMKLNTRPPASYRKDGSKDIGFNSKGPVSRYLFEEGNGNVIHDTGSNFSAVNLSMPKFIMHKAKAFLGVSTDYLQNESRYSDIVINILIFIPLGILIHGMLRTRFGLMLTISLAALLAGTLLSLGVESLQYFTMTRNSSLIDVFTNMTGTAIGIVMDRCYNLFLNYQAKHLWTQINTDRQDS